MAKKRSVKKRRNSSKKRIDRKKISKKVVEELRQRFLTPRRIFGIIMLIIVICGGIIFYYLDAQSRRTDDALAALKDGELERGLDICNNVHVDQYSDVCYITYIGMKINNKEEYDKSICDKISERRKVEKEKIGCYV